MRSRLLTITPRKEQPSMRNSCKFNFENFTMKKNPAIWIVALISIISGVLIFRSFTGALVTGLLGTLFWKGQSLENKKVRTHKNKRDGNLTLLLAAAVIKADGRIYQKERDLVRRKFEHDFGKVDAHQYMQKLETCLKQKVQVNAVCHHINLEFLPSEKIQILHFLIGIAVSTGVLVESEHLLLQKIANLLEIGNATYKSMLAMFNYSYQRQHATNSKSEQKQEYNYHSKPSPSRVLDNAYKILELTSSASNEEIKKAYRRLAKIHHPDRSIHLGEKFQKSAKEKFQKLQEAYDLIKSKRSFK